jgi:hypothetical protein
MPLLNIGEFSAKGKKIYDQKNQSSNSLLYFYLFNIIHSISLRIPDYREINSLNFLYLEIFMRFSVVFRAVIHRGKNKWYPRFELRFVKSKLIVSSQS